MSPISAGPVVQGAAGGSDCDIAALALENLGYHQTKLDRLCESRLGDCHSLQYFIQENILDRYHKILINHGTTLDEELEARLMRELAAGNIGNSQRLDWDIKSFNIFRCLRQAITDLLSGNCYSFTHLRQNTESFRHQLSDSSFIGAISEIAQRSLSPNESPMARFLVAMIQTGLLSAFIASTRNDPLLDIDECFHAGALADLGMIFIDDAILSKKAIRDQSDWNQILNHATISFRILAKSGEFTTSVLAGVHGHQQHDDQSGYPRHIAKPNPIARIVNIASAYQAMKFRGQSHSQIIRALRLHSKDLYYRGRCVIAMYEPSYIEALDELRVNQELSDTDKAIVFDQPEKLQLYIRKLLKLLERLNSLGNSLSRLLRTSSSGTRNIEPFVKHLYQMIKIPATAGIEKDFDFKEILQSSETIAQFDQQSRAIIAEMNYRRLVIERNTELIRRELLELDKHDLLVEYIAIAREISGLQELVKTEQDQSPWD